MGRRDFFIYAVTPSVTHSEHSCHINREVFVYTGRETPRNIRNKLGALTG